MPEGRSAFALRVGARHADIGEEAVVERGERAPFLRTLPPQAKGGEAPPDDRKAAAQPGRPGLCGVPEAIVDDHMMSAGHRSLPSRKTGQPWSAAPADRVVVAEPGAMRLHILIQSFHRVKQISI